MEARERGRGGKFAWRGEDRVGELRIYLLNGVEENPKKIAHQDKKSQESEYRVLKARRPFEL